MMRAARRAGRVAMGLLAAVFAWLAPEELEGAPLRRFIGEVSNVAPPW
jgi:hypothetical protein